MSLPALGLDKLRGGADAIAGPTHVWAERYDRDLTDIFAVQDEITEAVTIAVAPAIADAEQQRAMRKAPASLDAWAAYQSGLWHLNNVTAEDNALAQKFFQQAVDLDPSFAGGYKASARLRATRLTMRGAVYPKRYVRQRHWRAGRSRSMASMRRPVHYWLPHFAGAASTKAVWPRPRGL